MHRNQFFLRDTKLIIAIVMLLPLAYGCSTENSSESSINFDSSFLSSGQTFSFTFDNEGTVPYFCRNHVAEGMTGKVIVSQDATISGQDTVMMKNKQYNPSQITVKPGTKIVWINAENDTSIMDHTVTSGTSGSGGGPY